MTNPQNPLIKTCSVCGLQKPLSAFLQISDAQGLSYGNVCASCRKTQLEEEAPREPDESTSSTSGKKIDSKAKVAGDIERQEQFQAVEEDYHAEREKSEKEKKDAFSKDQSAIADKRKQQSFLKNRFLTTKTPIETRTAEGRSFQEQGNLENQNIEETDKKQQVTKEELRKTEVDFQQGPYLDTAFGVKEKQKGVAFNTFIRTVGTASPLARAAAEAAKKAGKNKAQTQATDQTPEDYIQEKWNSPKPRYRK